MSHSVDSPQADESSTVLRAQKGDGEAFRALVEAYDRRLLYFLRRILNESEEAFDVLQEVWLCVHRNLRTLRAPEAFRVWVYRIAHDQAMSALRRQNRSLPVDDRPADQIPDIDESERRKESAEQIHAALHRLSADHARVLTLHYLEEMGVGEISEVLACSVGTVKSRLHYARIALRRGIEEGERV